VKSLRTQAPNLRDAYVEIRPHRSGFEAWLLNTHISPYSHGNIWNHDPTRKRKLLLHRHQLEKLHGAVIQKGLTVVPLRMYFKAGLAKLELALAKGKKTHDKREDIKRKTAEREMEIAIKRR
jgi:SsrA-binding protein